LRLIVETLISVSFLSALLLYSQLKSSLEVVYGLHQGFFIATLLLCLAINGVATTRRVSLSSWKKHRNASAAWAWLY